MKYITIMLLLSFSLANAANSQDCNNAASCPLSKRSCNSSSAPSQKVKSESIVNNSHAKDSIHWQEYSPDTYKKFIGGNRLILLFGKIDTCTWSQKLISITFNDPTIIQLINKYYIPIYFDFYKNISVSKQYKITDSPSVVILDTNGNMLKTFEGYQSPDDMKGFLQSFANQLKQ